MNQRSSYISFFNRLRPSLLVPSARCPCTLHQQSEYIYSRNKAYIRKYIHRKRSGEAYIHRRVPVRLTTKYHLSNEHNYIATAHTHAQTHTHTHTHTHIHKRRKAGKHNAKKEERSIYKNYTLLETPQTRDQLRCLLVRSSRTKTLATQLCQSVNLTLLSFDQCPQRSQFGCHAIVNLCALTTARTSGTVRVRASSGSTVC